MIDPNKKRIADAIDKMVSQGATDDEIETVVKSMRSESAPNRGPTSATAITTPSKVTGPTGATGAPKQPWQSIIAPIAQGATLGLADEALGGIEGLNQYLHGGSFSKGYSEGVTKTRNIGNQYAQEHPVANLAAELGGAVATALPTAGRSLVKPGLSLAQRAGLSALEGGGIGAVAGAGSAQGGLSQRATGAAEGGIGGAALGGAIPVVGTVARGLRGALAPATKASAEKQAVRLIGTALQRDALAPADVAKEAVQFAGKPAILPDLGGENLLGLARAAQATPSRAKAALSEAVHGRSTEQLPRVSGDIEQALGLQRQDIHDLADRIIEARKENAAPLYEEAYSAGPIDNPKINELLRRPAMQRALAAARVTARDEGVDIPATSILAPFNPPVKAADALASAVHPAQGVDVRTLDYVKRALDDRISALYRKGANDKARVLSNLRGQMLTELDNTVPAFKAARDQFAGDSALRDALEAGKNFLNSDPRLVDKAVKGLTEGERTMYRMGALDAVRQAMDKAPDGADLTKRVFGNTTKRDLFKALLNNDEAFNSLTQKMGAESRMVRTKNTIVGGSPTARIEAELADMSGGDLGQLTAAGAYAAKGNLPMVAVRLGNAINRRARGNAGKVADILSQKMLLAPNTPEFQTLMQMILENGNRQAQNATRTNVARRALAGTIGSAVR